MSATAYERIIDAVRSQGKQVKTSESGKSARTQCPSLGCPAQSISLTIYDKRDQGKAKVVCFAGVQRRAGHPAGAGHDRY
jgi:hypothetical protein